jgi:tetratricopeptide (TPR) repeat protein
MYPYPECIKNLDFNFPDDFSQQEKEIFGSWIGAMCKQKPADRPAIEELCSGFYQLVALLNPSVTAHVAQKSSIEHQFFKPEDMLGTEVQIWNDMPRLEQIIPIGSGSKQQQDLCKRREALLSARSRLLGLQSRDALWCKIYVAWTLQYTGEADMRAYDYLNQVLQGLTEFPDLRQTVFWVKLAMGWSLMAPGRFSLALRQFEDATSNLVHTDDSYELNLYRCKSGIAEASLRLPKERNWSQSQSILEEIDAWKSQEENLGPHHPSTLDTRAVLANTYFKLRKYKKAVALYTKVTNIEGSIRGEESIHVNELVRPRMVPSPT